MAPRRGSEVALLVRPGARFGCRAGGLCCSDLHALGPLFPGDLERVQAVRADGAEPHPRLQTLTLRTGEDGACVFLSGGRCSLHGTPNKPRLCMRFPYGAVATPAGVRVTTAHRCPCRTLGARPPLDAAEAARSLAGEDGGILKHATIGDRVPLTTRTSMSFARYEVAEAAWIERLGRGEPVASVLGTTAAWPELRGPTWLLVGQTLRGLEDLGTTFDVALAWLGHALLVALGQDDPAPARPWAPFFDAEERATEPGDPDVVLGDFAADLLWDLRWAATGTFDRLATDLTLRDAASRAITQELRALGARPDRAAAEAVMIAEVAGESSPWRQALERAAPLGVRLPGAARATSKSTPARGPRG